MIPVMITIGCIWFLDVVVGLGPGLAAIIGFIGYIVTGRDQ